MFHKSSHSVVCAAPQDAAAPKPSLTTEQVEFARMLGAFLAALWVIEPSSASPPALHPAAPPSESKK